MTRIKIIVSVLFVCCTLFSSKRVEKVNIWLIGDSTMAPKSAKAYPELGWGEGLADYVTNKAKVHNHAVNGRSSLSFINEGRWQAVYDSLQKGDYVIIQFGHNDEKTDSARHTEPFGSFKQNIQKFIDEARKKGAIPMGPEKSKDIFLFTDSKQDSTHLNVAGAGIVAGLFVEEAKAQRLPIATVFK